MSLGRDTNTTAGRFHLSRQSAFNTGKLPSLDSRPDRRPRARALRVAVPPHRSQPAIDLHGPFCFFTTQKHIASPTIARLWLESVTHRWAVDGSKQPEKRTLETYRKPDISLLMVVDLFGVPLMVLSTTAVVEEQVYRTITGAEEKGRTSLTCVVMIKSMLRRVAALEQQWLFSL